MVDADKIKWREVPRDEYNDSHWKTPHRETYVGGLDAYKYELGTFPQELPTKRGAIIVPSKEWLTERDNSNAWDLPVYAPDTFFVYDGADWHAVDAGDGVIQVANSEVQEVLDAGGTIVFEGIED